MTTKIRNGELEEGKYGNEPLREGNVGFHWNGKFLKWIVSKDVKWTKQIGIFGLTSV